MMSDLRVWELDSLLMGLQGRTTESVLSSATAALSLLRDLESAAGIQPDINIHTGSEQPITQGAHRFATRNEPPKEGKDGWKLEEVISPQEEEDSLRLVKAAAGRNRKMKEFLNQGRDSRAKKADSEEVVLQFSAKNNAMRKYLMECKSNRDRDLAIPGPRLPRSERTSRSLESAIQSDRSHLDMGRNEITGMYTTAADMFPQYQTVQVPTPRIEAAHTSTESKSLVLETASSAEEETVLRAGSSNDTLANISPGKSSAPTPVRSVPPQQRERDVKVGDGHAIDSGPLQQVKSRRVQRRAAPNAPLMAKDDNSAPKSTVNRVMDMLPLMTLEGSEQEFFGGVTLQSVINPSSQQNTPPSPSYSAPRLQAPRATRAAAPGHATSNTPVLSHGVSPSSGPSILEGPLSAPLANRVRSGITSDGTTMLARPAPVLLSKTPRETPILRAGGMPQRASVPECGMVHASATTQQVAARSKTANEGPAPKLLVRDSRPSQDDFSIEGQQVSKGPVSSEDIGVVVHEEELPEGWEMKFDLTKGRYFYVHHDLQALSWVRPSAKVTLRSPVKVPGTDSSLIVSSAVDKFSQIESVSMYADYRVADYDLRHELQSPVAQQAWHGSPLAQHVMTPTVGHAWKFSEDFDVSPPFMGGSLLSEDAGDAYQNMSDSINVPQEVENELRQKLQEVMGDNVRYKQQQKDFVDNLLFFDLAQAVDEGGALIC